VGAGHLGASPVKGSFSGPALGLCSRASRQQQNGGSCKISQKLFSMLRHLIALSKEQRPCCMEDVMKKRQYNSKVLSK
jgi:hypothetical protein